MASDAGYLILIPLAAAAFASVGRHPLAGLASGFAGVAAIFMVNISLTPTDAMITEIANESLALAGGEPISIVANYFFMVASSIIMALVAAVVTEKIVEPRLGPWVPEGAVAHAEEGDIDKVADRRGSRFALIGFLIILAIVALATFLPGAPLRDPETGDIIGNTPFMDSLLFIIMLAFLVSGVCYGIGAGTMKGSGDVIAAITKTFAGLGGMVLMLLMIAQFIAYFNWTNLPRVIAGSLAELLEQADIGAIPLLIGFILVIVVLDFIMPGSLPKWAIFAPIFVPLFMRLGVAPQTLLAAYRVADSPVNALTPLMVYLPFIVTVAQRYVKKAGIGTIVALMLPYSGPSSWSGSCCSSPGSRSASRSARLPAERAMTSLPEPVEAFVSTGSLPAAAEVERILAEVHGLYRGVADGEPSRVYPALERVAPDLFGICVVSVGGRVFGVGDTDHRFTLMSVAKPFVFALACATVGADTARRLLGVNATGLPFNSVSAVERAADGRTNPMVNPGAIATSSLAPGDGREKWEAIRATLSAFAGRQLAIDEEVYASASATNHVNRAAVNLLHSRGALGCDPDLALDLYTRQSCLQVTAVDLATMGATLADGGVNPVTGERVIDRDLCHPVLAVMLTAGLYETSGDWLYEVGLPGKSGIGGGIVTISPGKGGLATFAPPWTRRATACAANWSPGTWPAASAWTSCSRGRRDASAGDHGAQRLRGDPLRQRPAGEVGEQPEGDERQRPQEHREPAVGHDIHVGHREHHDTVVAALTLHGVPALDGVEGGHLQVAARHRLLDEIQLDAVQRRHRADGAGALVRVMA
ncbi:glutaminase A [Tessaracoccus coleopterorum]|uniref:glutaminase A n=1 Tax=Tessaracoccus coleopterorum TaxID=2714950 RepID=UPI002F914D95